MSRSAPRRRERRIEAMQRRIEWLQFALARDIGDEYDRRADYQRSEVSALQWAVAVLRQAIQDEVILALEEKAMRNDTLPNGYAASLWRLRDMQTTTPEEGDSLKGGTR